MHHHLLFLLTDDAFVNWRIGIGSLVDTETNPVSVEYHGPNIPLQVTVNMARHTLSDYSTPESCLIFFSAVRSIREHYH